MYTVLKELIHGLIQYMVSAHNIEARFYAYICNGASKISMNRFNLAFTFTPELILFFMNKTCAQ